MKPMLGASQLIQAHEVNFPCIASYKLDGFRCCAVKGIPQSRTEKLIPNKFVQKFFADHRLHGFDGELMLKNTTEFESVQSAFMSHSGMPDFEYHVFDNFLWDTMWFQDRLMQLKSLVGDFSLVRIKPIEQKIFEDSVSLASYYKQALELGHEGLIVRDPRAIYKHGRSTFKQQWMVKMKPLKNMEATIIGVYELMSNEDTGTTKKENMTPMGTMGGFTCRMDNGIEFNVGTGKGLTDSKRAYYWRNRVYLLGKRISIDYQNLTKAGKPRFPRIKGLRPEVDA